MKKQLLIAAVAATMSSVSMADISLSGAGNMKVQSNGTSTIDMDLTLTAKSGVTTAVAKFKNLQDNTVTATTFMLLQLSKVLQLKLVLLRLKVVTVLFTRHLLKT